MKKNIRLITGITIFLFGVNSIFAQNSVLSTGNWYKIAVENTGIHQITYNDLVDYGIDPGQINPKHIRLYGNGNGMLPEDNDEFRHDDLQENSIFVFGENDGVFDPGDYILFYGESPTEWNYNEEFGWFEHEVNLYSDFTYYFITTDMGVGKRIETQFSTIIPHTYTSTGFNDYYYHELELENLIHSGRKWFGERFEETLEYNFEIEFPNIYTNHPVTFSTEVASRSSEPSNFNFEINGQSILTIGVPPSSMTTYANYAKTRWDSATFFADSSILNLTITYNKPTDNSIGWLDYFSFNAKRLNNFETGQMLFRDLESAGPGMVTMFQITPPNDELNIWNISDPLNPASIDYFISYIAIEFILETDSLLEFIVFDESQFYSPQFESMVANQNLHAIEPADMIIITHEDFIEEAQQLADFRETNDGISTFVTTPEKVYNEFSSGAQDITAIRDFMKYLYDKSNGEKPENLLLFGDATYDFKDIAKNETNYVPVWESEESLNPVSSYCSDDFYSEFDEEDKTSMLKIGIGRIPAKSPEEATAAVEKIIHYSSNENAFGSWRNEFCLIADDEDSNIHLDHAEDIAELVDTADHIFNITKIYLDAYEQVSNSNGQFYPDVNQAITSKINDGVNIIAHIGHGSYIGLANEKILTEEDLENWENYDYYPLLFTASCSFGQFDDPEKYSLTEKAVLMENRGLSSVIAATRPTYAGANHAFQKRFFINTLHHSEYSLGKLLKLSKQEAGGFDNNRKYCLFGDPSMRLAIPEYEIITEAINGVQVTEPLDTINPGEQLIVSGYIVDADGEPFYNFNGPLEVRIFDRIDTLTTLGNDPQSIVTDFLMRDSVLLTITTDILNGQFAFSFNLPNNIDEEYGTIKFSYYGMDFPLDARGQFADLVVGGQQSAINEIKAMDDVLTFYPIPVKSQLNCLAKQNINHLQLDLYDLTGRKIHSHSEQNIQKGKISSMELSALKPGLYIMWVNADQQFSTIKVIKQ